MAQTKKKTPDVHEIATAIERGCKHPSQVDEGSTYARNLANALRHKGWEDYETHSYCKVASYEAHLKKGHRRVEITSACFMGVFTDIRSWTIDECGRCETGS